MKATRTSEASSRGQKTALPPASSESEVEEGAVHERVYTRLRDLIISGQLSPGQALSLRSIARDFDVSAMPAREAIRRLATAGALEINDTRRVSVARVSQDRLEQIRVARLSLEPEIARRAVRRVRQSARQKKLLVDTLLKHDQMLDASIAAGDINGYAKYNSDFHFELYRAAESDVIFGLIESLWLQFGPTMRIVLGRMGTINFVEDLHKEAIAAVRAGDEDGVSAAIHADIKHGLDTLCGESTRTGDLSAGLPRR